MSKRARTLDPNGDMVLEKEQRKRYRLDMDAMVERVAKLRREEAPFGYYELLLPEIKQLIGYKMPLRDLVHWLQTEKALAEPRFLQLFWQTLVKTDYRSPLTGQLHRFVVHAEQLFNEYCRVEGLASGSLAWLDKAVKFWHATFFNASVATRIALYLLDEPMAYEVRQTIAGLARVLSVPEATLHESRYFPHERPVARTRSGKPNAYKWEWDGPAMSRRVMCREFTIARNNWLALAADSERRLDQQRSLNVQDGCIPLAESGWAPQVPGASSWPSIEGVVVVNGLSIRLRIDRETDWEHDKDEVGGTHATLTPPTDDLFLRSSDAGGGVVLFNWEQRPVLRGRVYANVVINRAEYALYVDAIDVDAMLDWAAAHVKNSPAPERPYWVVNLFFRDPLEEYDGHTEPRRWTLPDATAKVVDPDSRTSWYYKLATVPFNEWRLDWNRTGYQTRSYVETYLLTTYLPFFGAPTYFAGPST